MSPHLIRLCALLCAWMPCLTLADERHCPEWVGKTGGENPTYAGEISVSPYTLHWHSSEEHKPVKLGAIDENMPGNRFCGLSLFTNSFGQPSGYLYVGQRYDNLFNHPQLFVKVTAGVLYGYVGKYQHKVPMNHNGFSPAIIPSLGYAFTPRDSVQVMVLGTAGLTLAYARKY